MAKSKRVSVGTTAVKVIDAGSGPWEPNRVLIRIPASPGVFFGGPDVDVATNGFQWANDTSNRPLEWNAAEDLWAVTASGTAVVHVIEEGR